jgi:ribosomal protein S27E
MLESIRTFFGRTKGLHQDKQTVIVEARAWRCTKCGKVFLNQEEGKAHVSKNPCMVVLVHKDV